MTRQTILLIQSAQTEGNGTKRHLEERGYKVIWAGSGLTALMAARNEPINLILLDVALPDIEGTDLCHRFRVRQDTRSIPIIVLTSSAYMPERTAGKPYGPDGYLEKPYTESELEDLITAVLLGRPAATTKASELPPGQAQTAGLQGGPGLGGEPAQLREPRPALITVTQSPEADPKPVPKAVTRPDLRLVSKPGTRVHGKSEPAPPLSRVPASTQEPPAGPKQDSPPSPILPFRGTGDAVVDPATGLFGRPQFEAMLSKEFKRAVRFKQQMSCMLIDLDGRKMGRRAGDALVKAIVGLVQKTIREVDTAAWWSGVALIVLLPNTARRDALQAAARILDAVANHPFTLPDATNVTMSIGVAGLPDKNIVSEQKLIEAAHTMCRRAQELMVPPPIDVRSIKR